MKQLILRFLRPNLRVLIMSSLCFVMLATAMFSDSSTNAIRLDSQPSEVWHTSEQPITVAAGITLTVNTLGDAADINLGEGAGTTRFGAASPSSITNNTEKLDTYLSQPA